MQRSATGERKRTRLEVGPCVDALEAGNDLAVREKVGDGAGRHEVLQAGVARALLERALAVGGRGGAERAGRDAVVAVALLAGWAGWWWAREGERVSRVNAR